MFHIIIDLFVAKYCRSYYYENDKHKISAVTCYVTQILTFSVHPNQLTTEWLSVICCYDEAPSARSMYGL
jgi:hypothetical protein